MEQEHQGDEQDLLLDAKVEAELAALDAAYDAVMDPKTEVLFSRLTPADWYRQGVATLLDGVIFPCLRHRGGLRALLSRAQETRHLRALDHLALLYPISKTQESPEWLEYHAERARIKLLRGQPLLKDVLCRAVAETLEQEGPLEQGDAHGWREGLKGAQIDSVLERMGLRLGPKNRANVLKRMQADEAAVQNTAHRWKMRRPVSDAAGARADNDYRRFCFLSMLDKTVVQRFMGAQGTLWFMGFNETSDGRGVLLEQLAHTSRTWLEARAVRISAVKPGDEPDLVWIQTGMMMAAKPKVPQPLPEWLVHELELTVIAGVQARLGLAGDGNDFFRRALVDREQRYQQACHLALIEQWKVLGRADTPEPGCPPPSLHIATATRKHWGLLPSFESPEQDRLFARGKLPTVMIHVLRYLRERFPSAQTVYQIYEHAQAHWPSELTQLRSIDWACRRLEAFHLIAQCSIRAADNRSGRAQWVRGYQALKFTAQPPTPHSAPKSRLGAVLEEMLDCMGNETDAETPRFSTTRYIVRRAEVPAYLELLRSWREQVGSAFLGDGDSLKPGAGLSLLCLQVATDSVDILTSHKA